MTHKLWQTKGNSNSLVEDFTSGDDLFLDQHLALYDILGSLAHTKMLTKQKYLTPEDYQKIKTALLHLKVNLDAGKLYLKVGDEDIHTRIENEITALHPQAGGNVHIGRSRNDQVLTDIRLFSKSELLEIAVLVVDLIDSFVQRAEAEKETVMPGYTHLQPAMLSSVGLWLAQFAESLCDDLKLLKVVFELNDQSPLGSGASYGVALPLDREYTASLLGFAKVQNNALYCQNSRGKIEQATVHSLVQVMNTLGRFASDMVLFTSHEFKFFDLPAELTTGSSIMPQKRNFDLMELLRAKSKIMMGYEFQIASVVTGLPSGYNRDLQEIKKPYFNAFELVKKSLHIAHLSVQNLTIDNKKLHQHIGSEMFAAHWAYELMKAEDLSFRQAYFKVKENLDQIPKYDAVQVLKATKSQGAPGNLNLKTVQSNLKKESQFWHKKQKEYHQVLTSLLEK